MSEHLVIIYLRRNTELRDEDLIVDHDRWCAHAGNMLPYI